VYYLCHKYEFQNGSAQRLKKIFLDQCLFSQVNTQTMRILSNLYTYIHKPNNIAMVFLKTLQSGGIQMESSISEAEKTSTALVVCQKNCLISSS
jgi:hypothetical protein